MFGQWAYNTSDHNAGGGLGALSFKEYRDRGGTMTKEAYHASLGLPPPRRVQQPGSGLKPMPGGEIIIIRDPVTGQIKETSGGGSVVAPGLQAPKQIPDGGGTPVDSGGFDFSSMFSNLPSWVIPVALIGGAFLLLKKR